MLFGDTLALPEDFPWISSVSFNIESLFWSNQSVMLEE
jgi:hypothetical protein